MSNQWIRAEIALLLRLKDQKRRFIILEPYENAVEGQEGGWKVLLLNYYEALIKARGFASRMKGKYQFIFDLENRGHFDKLNQMLNQSAEYRVYVGGQLAETNAA
ncbi:hypothetical protein LWM68_12960 [Niabella sp. W65]|nr:hypothetical protein [Niabella sp. W65]MCH7363579.1 hypothetical protein [Niabella sp. W65]ULT39493.1 hypothetical protein KRR40_31750 [Niabella sp. I65]